MNLDLKRYKAIDVEQAAILLIHGHKIFNSSGNAYHIDKHTKVVWMTAGNLMGDTNLTVQELLTGEWFAKKPFDVRQAMIERPNEWVGAFFDEDSESWRKVGFDFKNFKAIEACIKDDVVTDFYKYGVSDALQEELDACIPIEDVPEEA